LTQKTKPIKKKQKNKNKGPGNAENYLDSQTDTPVDLIYKIAKKFFF
jgi:hypothetical protein